MKISAYLFIIMTFILFLLSPWINGFGCKFTIKGMLTNPDRLFLMQCDNGQFDIINYLEGGNIRQSSGIYGAIGNTVILFVTEKSYLTNDKNVPRSDYINYQDDFFKMKIIRLGLKENNALLLYSYLNTGSIIEAKVSISGVTSLKEKIALLSAK